MLKETEIQNKVWQKVVFLMIFIKSSFNDYEWRYSRINSIFQMLEKVIFLHREWNSDVKESLFLGVLLNFHI